MNTLSWLIYAADRSFPFTTVLAVSGLGALFVWFMVCVCVGDHNDNTHQRHHSQYGADKRAFPSKKWLLFGLLVPFAFLIPPSDTIYLIAASELGEHVVTTPEAQEVFDKLQQILNQQLDRLVGEAGT